MREERPDATAVGALLKERGDSIAVAESSAGGLISAALLSVPGASAYYRGGAVTYTGVSRTALVGVTDEMIAGMRASTEEYALLLARTIRDLLGTTWGVAETGATGPAGNRYGDAAGHACFAVAGPVERAVTLETGHGDRDRNMAAFAKGALGLLEEALRA
jgi:nicotinamide-nucleotide amidase